MSAPRSAIVYFALLILSGPLAAQAPADPTARGVETTPAATPATSFPEPTATPAPSAGPAAAVASPPEGAASASPPSGTEAAPTSPAPEGTPAVVEAPPPPEPTLIVSADLTSQRVTITENGVAKHTWPISSGTRGYRTKTGRFTPTWTSRMHYSRQWDWAPMPYAVFFNRGTAFHGTYATRALGRPASHGCIRLTTSNAKTLYNLVHRHGLRMTRVVVHGAPRFKEPAVAATRRAPSGYASRYARPRDGRYTYSNPYYEPPRRRRFVQRPHREYGPYGGVWD